MKTFSTLIDAPALSDLMQSGNTVVLDCRFNLMDVGEGYSNYRTGHLPGARYAHMDNDLCSPVIDGQTGRHPLPDPVRFVAFMRACGADNDTQIVCYDDAGGSMAVRAWWLCQYAGHEAAAVLNGGYPAWQALDLPISTEIPALANGNFSIRPARAPLANADDLLDTANVCLVDAREPFRFRGDSEPLDKVAGRIPGAINFPYKENFNNDLTFIDQTTLQSRFNDLTTLAEGRKIVHYCGSGVTAAVNVIAALHAGFGAQALYAGSWSEWIADGTRAIETGPMER